MSFYYLLLGHLIGDFALQSDKMAENKGKYWKWNLLHALVVTLCTLIFSYPFGTALLVWIPINGVIHFILDYYKSEIKRLLHLSELAVFLLDQFMHIIILYFISRAAVYGNQQMPDFLTVKILIVLMLLTSFSAVFTQFVLAALFPRSDSRFFEEGEKNIGILTRVYAAVVFYLSFTQSVYFLLLLVIAAVAFFQQFKLGWNKWMGSSQLIVKLLLDTAISVACVLMII